MPVMRTRDHVPLTRASVRDAIQKGESLASVLRMVGHPLALMPAREDIADVLETLARAARLVVAEVEP